MTLQIASAERTARDLSVAGLKIDGPTPGTIMRPGDKEPPPPMWWLVRFGGPQFVDPDTASRPVFLIQYATRPAGASPRPAPPRPANPNSASSLFALLIAVNNLPNAMVGYGMIGKAGAEEIPLPEFGAVGSEAVLERGSILLLRATDACGPTARRITERGEGILAVRLLATDLDQVRRQIGPRNVAKEKQSVLVSPENPAGVWLEFQPTNVL